MPGRLYAGPNVERSEIFGPREGDLAFVAGHERSALDFDQCTNMEHVECAGERLRCVLSRELFGTSEHRAEVEGGSSEATSFQVFIDVPQEAGKLRLVDLSSSVEQTKSVPHFQVVEWRPRDGAMLAKFPAGTFRVRFGHVDGDQRARVEVGGQRSPRSVTSC